MALNYYRWWWNGRSDKYLELERTQYLHAASKYFIVVVYQTKEAILGFANLQISKDQNLHVRLLVTNLATWCLFRYGKCRSSLFWRVCSRVSIRSRRVAISMEYRGKSAIKTTLQASRIHRVNHSAPILSKCYICHAGKPRAWRKWRIEFCRRTDKSFFGQ